MEDPLGSIFNSQEGAKELRQKLMNTTIELENMRNVNAELINLLNMAHQERDEAKDQLQKLLNKLMMMPSSTTSNELKNNNNNNNNNNNPSSFEVVHHHPESLLMVLPNPTTTTTKANSSITESNSLSHASSPVDAVSSPEFSNMSNVVVVDPPYLNLNQSLGHHDFKFNNGSSQSFAADPASAVIDYLAMGKALPQQGRLLQAVMEAGPLLQNLLLAGPLPTWRNPPPLQEIKVPPLAIAKDLDNNGIELATWNSTSLVNFGGCNNSASSWNNSMRFTSNAAATLRNNAPPRIPQRGQIY